MAHLFQAIYIYITFIFCHLETKSQGNSEPSIRIKLSTFWCSGFLLYQTSFFFSPLLPGDKSHAHSEKEMNIQPQNSLCLVLEFLRDSHRGSQFSAEISRCPSRQQSTQLLWVTWYIAFLTPPVFWSSLDLELLLTLPPCPWHGHHHFQKWSLLYSLLWCCLSISVSI